MNVVARRILTIVAVVVLAVSVLGISGCKKAPKLSNAQLAAGQIPAEHPVDQATATAKGCSCHTK